MASLVAQSIKNLPAMKGTTFSAGETGLIPGLGRSTEKGNNLTLYLKQQEKEKHIAIFGTYCEMGLLMNCVNLFLRFFSITFCEKYFQIKYLVMLLRCV